MKYLFILYIFLSLPVNACKCSEVSVDEYLETCDSIFISRVEEARLLSEGGTKIITGRFGSPKEILKGTPDKIIGLQAVQSGSSCDLPVVVGVDYLVCGTASGSYVSYSYCDYTKINPEQYNSILLKELRMNPYGEKFKNFSLKDKISILIPSGIEIKTIRSVGNRKKVVGVADGSRSVSILIHLLTEFDKTEIDLDNVKHNEANIEFEIYFKD